MYMTSNKIIDSTFDVANLCSVGGGGDGGGGGGGGVSQQNSE